MTVYKNSFVSEDDFDFENVILYFKNPNNRRKSKYETLMDSLSDKIQHLLKPKRVKYTKFMINIITHLSVLSRFVQKEIENMICTKRNWKYGCTGKWFKIWCWNKLYTQLKNYSLSISFCIPSFTSASESGSDIKASWL